MREVIGGLLALLVLSLGAATADEAWKVLAGAEATKALSGHILAYANGATQTFSPSGDTGYDSGHLQPGKWRIDGDKYCSVWPPSDQWACYKLEASADGKSLRFTAGDGSTTEGQVVGN